MKKFLGWAFLFLASHALAGDRFWVIGDDYVLYSDSSSKQVVYESKSTSSGFDAKSCSVLTADSETQSLKHFSIGVAPQEIHPGASRVLSDANDFFLTFSDDKIERRDRSGSLFSSHPAEWAKNVIQIVGNDAKSWALIHDEEAKQLSLAHLEKFQKTSTTLITKYAAPFGFPHLRLDGARETLWVGMNVSLPGVMYAPAIEKRSLSGELKQNWIWRERAILFDTCLDHDGSLLASRDVPSGSHYTVPFYSVLEKASHEKAERVYRSGDNAFLDTLACRKDVLYMVQRSIFGSDGSYVVKWDRKSGSTGAELFRLPKPARRLYLCAF